MQNLGFKPNINQFIANQTGYTGNLGGGGLVNWMQTPQGAPYAQQIQNYMTGMIPGQQRNQQLQGFNFGSQGAINPGSMNQRTNNYNAAGASLIPRQSNQQGLLYGGAGSFVKGGSSTPQKQTNANPFDISKYLPQQINWSTSGGGAPSNNGALIALADYVNSLNSK